MAKKTKRKARPLLHGLSDVADVLSRTVPGTYTTYPGKSSFNRPEPGKTDNRGNRSQSDWKKAEHVILNETLQDSDIAEIIEAWRILTAADPSRPHRIQKLYLTTDANKTNFTVYDALGFALAEGPLKDLLLLKSYDRQVVFANLEQKFEVWLHGEVESGDPARYCGRLKERLKAMTEPYDPDFVPVTEVWPGFYFRVTGKAYTENFGPKIYDVRSEEEFNQCYGILKPFFTDKSFDGTGLAEANFKQCHDYVWANSEDEVVVKDQGYLRNGFVKYCAFLKDMELTYLAEGCMDNSRQIITYGAPGTGKSFGTDGKLIDARGNPKAIVFRTTFHPDSDYSTFVGAYKPTMKTVPRIVQDGTTLKKPNFANGFSEDLKVEEKISYEFRPQAFLNAYVAAWKNPAKPVVLIIEEINRGNCAQIFGDLFQLLDRDEATGYSSYPITADTDLAKWLKEASRFGADGLADPGRPDCIRADDWTKVLKGEMLALPGNLYIWATMNTSDQSLFPIDSAFKRRWDWKYVPIREGKNKDGDKLGWTIKFSIPGKPAEGGRPAVPEKKFTYDWWKFLLCINKLIFKTTESEDKKLGYFFVKPDKKSDTEKEEKDVISADRFVDKVVFYLWNDVFKDYGVESVFKNEQIEKADNDEDGQAVAFERFFVEEGDKADPRVLAAFFKALKFEPDQIEEVTATAAPQPAPASAPAEVPVASADATADEAPAALVEESPAE